jgi:hypothetical protein
MDRTLYPFMPAPSTLDPRSAQPWNLSFQRDRALFRRLSRRAVFHPIKPDPQSKEPKVIAAIYGYIQGFSIRSAR